MGGVLAAILIGAGVTFVLSRESAPERTDRQSRPAKRTPEIGSFPERDVEGLVGFPTPRPSFLPGGLRRTGRKVIVRPRDRLVVVGYSSTLRKGEVPRGLSVQKARRGGLSIEGREIGLKSHRRRLRIRGQPAFIDSWTTAKPGQSDTELKYRLVRWDERGFSFLVLGEAVEEEDVVRVARTTR